MLNFLVRIVWIGAAASVGGVGFAQTEVRLTPAEEYAEIPTRSEAVAKETPVPAVVDFGKRPPVERTPHATGEIVDNGGDDVATTGGTDSGLTGPANSPAVDDILTPPVYGSISSGATSNSQLDRIRPDNTFHSIPVQSVPPEDVADVLGEGTYGSYDGEPEIDLSSYLPVPGKQTKHNCVAWAIAYASYSCQVTQQRRAGKPKLDHHIFSPSFIYNTLSKGRNEGLYVGEAIDFIKKNGCATLHTMPLGDEQPSTAAKKEAKLYRAIGHQRATGIKDIRAYLQEGYPVILVVRLDTELCECKFDEIYRWDQSKMTDKIVPHAVCAVGYDDDRKAVLVMNSSGAEWNTREGDSKNRPGFFWVSYDTLETIPDNRGGKKRNGQPVRDEELPYWCVEAHVVIVKERSPSVALEFDDFDVRFQVKNGMVYNGKLRVTFDVTKNSEWQIDDLATNQETIFLLRRDQTVLELHNHQAFVFDEATPLWSHLTQGVPANSKINMIAAADDTPVFALTNRGVLLKMDAKQRMWQPMEMPETHGLVFEDLRDHQSEYVTATSTKGRIFRFEPETGWGDLLAD